MQVYINDFQASAPLPHSLQQLFNTHPGIHEFQSRLSALEGICFRGRKQRKMAALGRSNRDVSLDASLCVCLHYSTLPPVVEKIGFEIRPTIEGVAPYLLHYSGRWLERPALCRCLGRYITIKSREGCLVSRSFIAAPGGHSDAAWRCFVVNRHLKMLKITIID